ncbi:sensor histidine kinase [Streptomyces polygonati]|uniref:Sensor histidine kinase n=1 Tax=Streptomyces polygonati TaxID=1617087 RepID=A0ABV8HJY4_9ACTN
MRHDAPTTGLSVGELLGSRRGAILEHLEHRLRDTGSSLGKDPAVLPACIARADALLTATMLELDQLQRPVAPSDQAPAADGTSQGDTPPGGSGLLMDVVLKELLYLAVEQPELLPEVSVALTVLHANLTSSRQSPGDSYDAYILRSAEEARRRERRHMAQEVHDELGHELSIALHQLELSELYREQAPETAVARVGTAREHLSSALAIVRRLIVEFAERPSVDLTKEIVSFADAAGALRTAVHVRVTGNQLLIPGGHRHELFLIIREALLNVFAHAAAERAIVFVDVTSEGITAVVEDDGVGFSPARGDASGSGATGASADAGGARDGRRRGFGLTSMRERAMSLGGTVTIEGSDEGTRVEIRLPLS